MLPHQNNTLQLTDGKHKQSTNNPESFDYTEEQRIFDYDNAPLFDNNDIDIQNIFNENQIVEEEDAQEVKIDRSINNDNYQSNEVSLQKATDEESNHQNCNKTEIDDIHKSNANEESDIRGRQPIKTTINISPQNQTKKTDNNTKERKHI